MAVRSAQQIWRRHLRCISSRYETTVGVITAIAKRADSNEESNAEVVEIAWAWDDIFWLVARHVRQPGVSVKTVSIEMTGKVVTKVAVTQ
jgi:hypothetical protein